MTRVEEGELARVNAALLKMESLPGASSQTNSAEVLAEAKKRFHQLDVDGGGTLQGAELELLLAFVLGEIAQDGMKEATLNTDARAIIAAVSLA